MPLEAIAIEKMDFGPGTAHFDGDYLGRTQGATAMEYGIDTSPLETEEDGAVDEVVTADVLTVTVPIVYTDVENLGIVIPWATVAEESGDKKLVVPKAIGQRLSQYAKELILHPIAEGDDKDKDVVIHKCYPKPGPINFGYARDGTRIANVQFVALETPAGDYFTIGDPDVDADPIISTKHTVSVGDDDPALVLTLRGDTFGDTANVENTGNWTFAAGATTLTLESVHKTGDKEAVIVLNAATGAEAGTFSIQAKADALVGTDPSNVLSITVQT